jgi:Xaa-Pro aminopeptidase
MKRVVGVMFVGMALVAAGMPAAQIQQGPFTEIFPPEEFAARRAKLMERIGDAVAILQGTIERPGEQAFRQNNHVFYLSGVEVTRAIIVIDGRTRRSVAYIPPLAAGRVRGQGPEIGPGADAAKLTGLDAVLVRDEFAQAVTEFAAAGRVIYTPHRPEVLGNASVGEPRAQANATRNDPWDGRPSRETVFIEKLKAAAPTSEIRDLDPIVDSLRAVKSPREIALIREATRLSGEAIMAAMREARVGMYEYELQAPAEYVFK